jgi:hypothetical protein
MKTEIYKLLSGAKRSLFAFVFTLFLGTTYSQTPFPFSYTGGIQTMLLQPGNYRLEVWGADGADGTYYSAQTPNNLINGGKGGFSTGTVSITSPMMVYIVVGGKGSNVLAGNNLGGYNGGGNSSSAPYQAGSGGGASHIASATGLLSTLSGNQAAVMIVAGGGGGGGNQSLGGDAGGLNGVQPPPATQFSNRTAGGGGTQTTGGTCFSGGSGAAFGQGGTTTQNLAGGGGGGWYGGCTGDNSTAGGGGSGYIGGVTNGTTVGTGQPGFVADPDITGNGYIIITRLCAVTASAAKNPICFGESVDLSTDAVTGVVWGHTSSTSNTVNVAPTVNTNYTVTGQAASGCTTSIVMSITVNPLPTLSAAVNPSVLCVGKTATINAFGANSYTWAASNTSGNTTTVNPTVTSNFIYSGTNQYNCVNTSTVSVIVNTNVLGMTSNTTICKGNSINLIASGALSYTWSTGSLFVPVSVTPLTNTSYTASGTDIHNCVISSVVSITVADPPAVLATANKTLVCKGESVSITGSGASTYTWSTGFVGATLTTILPIDIPYYFSVTGTDANGCTKLVNITITAAKCLGINEGMSNSMAASVVPNPGTGLYNVRMENVTGQFKMTVLNGLGQVIKTQDIRTGDEQLDIQNEQSGIYFVRISENGNTLKVIKLIKE